MMSDQDIERLAHPEFWDERYATAEDSAPTHEWFRTFAELLPFLQPKLFNARPPATNPKILHLGSGDSVRLPWCSTFSILVLLWCLSAGQERQYLYLHVVVLSLADRLVED